MNEGFIRKLKGVPPDLMKSITYDQGCEMAQHEQLAAALNLAVYFCNPHATW
jgi:IS30 family transposase